MRRIKIFLISILIISSSVLGFNFTQNKISDKTTVKVYFLKTSQKSNTIPVAVKRRLNPSESAIKTAITELLDGPTYKEQKKGFYTEIPKGTTLLGVKETKEKITINLSQDFETGGGADSMFGRINQLVTTATSASAQKPVYLEIEGEKADVVGGEGIIIEQPLSENLKQGSNEKE